MISKAFKLITILILSISAFIILFVIVVNLHIVNSTKKYIYNDLEVLKNEISPVIQATVVLGAGVYPDGSPSPMLSDRLDTGYSVYKSGLSKKLILSGDHGKQYYDETNAMKNYILDKGIALEDLFLDQAGFSTYDSMVRAARIFKVNTAIVVTQGFHISRAVYIARKSGIDAYGITSDNRQFPRSELLRYTIREWFARTKDFIYVNILKPDPVYLGDEIPITEDGKITQDD